MKLSPKCVIARGFKDLGLKHIAAIEYFKNVHVPNCPTCRKQSSAIGMKPGSVKALGKQPMPKPKREGKVFLVKSFTDAKKVYTVMNFGKKWECSCPRWIYSDRKNGCKHIVRVKEQLAA